MSRGIVHGSWANKVVASDLLDERAKRDFDDEQGRAFKNILNQEELYAREEQMNVISSDPILRNSHTFYDMTREEMWIDHMRKFNRAWQLRKEQWFTKFNPGKPNLWSYMLLG